MAIRAKSITVSVRCINITTNAPITGDAANITIQVVKDGVTGASTNAVAEVSSTNAPGIYKLVLTAAEMTADFVVVCGKSATASSRIDGWQDSTIRVPDVDPGASTGLIINGANSGTVTLAALTVTGSFTISNGLLVSRSSANTSAIVATGNGTGHGIAATSGSGVTGDGINSAAASTNGNGLNLLGTGSGAGELATAGASGNGAKYVGGVLMSNAAGDALALSSSGGNGAGLRATANGSGGGIVTVGGATGPGLAASSAGNGNGITAVGASGGNSIAATNSGAGDCFNMTTNGSGNGINIGLNGGAGIGFRVATSGSGNAVDWSINGGAGTPLRISTSGGADAVSIATTNGNGNGIVVGAQGSGNGLLLSAGATGHGLQAIGGATSGFGLNLSRGGANVSGNFAISGNLSMTHLVGILDDFSVTNRVEPAALPAASAPAASKLDWLQFLARNKLVVTKLTSTTGTMTARNDGDSLNVASAAVSDDGTTATRAKYV